MFVLFYKQENAERYRQPDITEIEKIEYIVLCQPQRHGNRFKDCEYDERLEILFDLSHDSSENPMPFLFGFFRLLFRKLRKHTVQKLRNKRRIFKSVKYAHQRL